MSHVVFLSLVSETSKIYIYHYYVNSFHLGVLFSIWNYFYLSFVAQSIVSFLFLSPANLEQSNKLFINVLIKQTK